MDLSTFATLLRKRRRRLHLTQPQAAALVGVSTRLWSECERNARPNVSLQTALRMLEVLGIDLKATRRAVAGQRVSHVSDAGPHATEQLRQAIPRLYPEHLGAPIDLEQHARSVILRAMNAGPDALREAVLKHYGLDRVTTVLGATVDRLDTPVYQAWKSRLRLPRRSAGAVALHRLWRR